MNSSLISLEIAVIGLGLVLMLADLFVPAERRRFIGYAGIATLGALLVSLSSNGSVTGTAFNGSFVNDGLALFFKALLHHCGHARPVHGRGIFRPPCRRQHRGILFAHRLRAGGNVVRRVGQ